MHLLTPMWTLETGDALSGKSLRVLRDANRRTPLPIR